MTVPFTLTNFSGGMKGAKGQFNSADITNVQDLNNILVERNNSLKTRNGVTELPFTLLTNDKILPFVHNGRNYYFVYDPLLNLNYTTSVGSTTIPRSMGGQRHVDAFSRYNSSLSALNYLKKEIFNHRDLMQSRDDITYSGLIPASPQDDVAKWAEFKDFDILAGDYLVLHQYLRKLTWESSPTFVFTEQQKPNLNASLLLHTGTQHSVRENTFWWNRMFVLDENFNIITTEIDLANFVSYNSGHVPLVTINSMDTEVRNSTHTGLQTIREARYGGSDLVYDVEVMAQGVLFYNSDGLLPNMFIQLNDQGQTDGVLRDFRTLYLDEVPNGIFKTAPYFTDAEYASQQLFDIATMRLEMKYITEQWDIADNLLALADYNTVLTSLDTFYAENAVTDYANNNRVKFSYNVKDPENNSDVLKAFLPLTSDSSPAVAIDNIRFDEADGQVRFASPSLANMDRDFVFPHDSTSVWQNEALATELPFIFSPNLVIYHQSFDIEPITGRRIKYSSPILTFMNNADSLTTFALIPITRYSGGAIGKFNAADATFRPIRINSLTSAAVSVTADADYLPTVVYTQAFGLYKFDASINIDVIADDAVFPVKLGYFVDEDTYYILKDFKTYTTTYKGNYKTTSSGFFGSSSQQSSYTFTVFQNTGGSDYSVLKTNSNQLSKAIGFNANSYYSSIVEFASRLYLSAKEAPNVLVYSSTTDYLEFSVVRALVNAETDPVATRGGRLPLGNENIEALHESNNTLRVITNRRIFTADVDDLGLVVASNPSDIVTSGKTPVTINNFTYFVSGDNRDVLLSVFSDKTQRFEYYSVFSSINIDDETEIVSFLSVDATYRIVVLTEQALYIGTIIQANQVAWSRLTFSFTITSVSSTVDTLYITSDNMVYALAFLTDSDLEVGVQASMKLLSPVAMASLITVPKTNVNYIGLQFQDVTLMGTFDTAVRTGSDARPLVSSRLGNIIDIANKNFNNIYDSIEISFEGGQNRIIYLRGSLGV